MVLTVIVAVLVLLILGVWIFLKQAPFGSLPIGDMADRVSKSANYRKGFQNISYTPSLAEGATYLGVMKKFFLTKNKRARPSSPLPSVKTDLRTLDENRNWLVWFGHSSYFLQIAGKKILVDPVFSRNASPVTFTTRSFGGSDVYTAADMPEIDLLFISHDHWDHLDYKTVVQLRPKIKKVITGIGVGAHLLRWGYAKEIIHEMDWNEELNAEHGFTVRAVTARHFSGRGLKRNTSLWTSFVVAAPGKKIFLGGDSGYDTHFKDIGDKFGPFDLVIVENGQYNADWKYIHMMPEECVRAAIDLKAKLLLPVHWGRFILALHDWDEPIKRAVKEARVRGVPVLHPMIGQLVDLDAPIANTEWWLQNA